VPKAKDSGFGCSFCSALHFVNGTAEFACDFEAPALVTKVPKKGIVLGLCRETPRGLRDNAKVAAGKRAD
jgi:hypothetical protein